MLHRPLSSSSSSFPSFSLHRIAAAMFRGNTPRGGRRVFSHHLRDNPVSANNDYRRVYYSYDNNTNTNTNYNNQNSSNQNSNGGGAGVNDNNNNNNRNRSNNEGYRGGRGPYRGGTNQFPQQRRPRPPDYRNWEFPKLPPPHNSERFKLLYEECIEFNKLGMRDNVAQVCVLEYLVQNRSEKKSEQSGSSVGPNRVVIGNIHVLYNPRRGEIKLGQVRVLLERAQAVSKKWDDAPVVLCGDFNCVPKSPLYDFISEQKLDISAVDRDKVSGQATAEILPTPREFGRQEKGPSADIMASPTMNQDNSVDRRENHFLEKLNLSEGPSKGNSQSQLSPDELVQNASDKFSNELFNSTISSQEVPVERVELTEDGCSAVTVAPDIVEEESMNSCNSNSVSCSKSFEIDTSDTRSNLGASFASRAQASEDKSNEINKSLAFKKLDEKLAGLSLGEINETSEDTEDLGEGAEKVPDDLNDDGDAFPSNPDEAGLEDLLSSTSESEAVEVDEPAYDRSRWTPVEIATATGNLNNTVVEHSLKLKSTYTEVEDRSGTRDSTGEPLVTSYNSRFMGTVDYIWRSEGLCTVKALAPIPKNTMQQSGGFPTKKWGSDHIALATELAFTK